MRKNTVEQRTKAIEQYRLGMEFFEGKKVPQDYTQAVYWFKLSAEKGNMNAQFMLGKCYYYGNGVEKDDTQAAYWYSKASKKGHADAHYILGYIAKRKKCAEKESYTNKSRRTRIWKK